MMDYLGDIALGVILALLIIIVFKLPEWFPLWITP